MHIIDGDKCEAFSLNFDDTKSDEIMGPFDGIINTDLAVRAYDFVLKNKKDSSSADFSDLDCDFCEEENEIFKNAYPIHEMDLETLARILSGQINLEDLSRLNHFDFNSNNSQNSSQRQKSQDNQDNPQNYTASDFSNSENPQKKFKQNSSYQENQDSENTKKAYFEEDFDFDGTTMFDFEDYLKRTRVPTLEEEAAAKKAEKKS